MEISKETRDLWKPWAEYTQNFKKGLKEGQKCAWNKTTRIFIPNPVSAWQKPLFQFDLQKHEKALADIKNLAERTAETNTDSAPIKFKLYEL